MDFDDWVRHVFDHPVSERHWEQTPDYWHGPEATIIAHMTRLFAEANTVLAAYSDAQAAQGLWAMCSQDISEYPLSLTAMSLPLRARLDCLGAMDTLFLHYFARRCTPHLSHLDIAALGTPAHVSPLNGVCYMWWDVMPLGSLMRNPEWPSYQSALLTVFRHCLDSDSVACQESAVLGLMNWVGSFEWTSELEDVEARIQSREGGVWPRLREFRGRVL